MADAPRTSRGRDPAVEAHPPPRTLPPDATAPSVARRYVGQVLARLELDHLEDVATLAVSELVTNALLHAGPSGQFAVRVVPRPAAQVRIEVTDTSTAIPLARRYASTASVGRGLALLSALGVWGAQLLPGGGKVVWFEPAPADRDPPDAPGRADDGHPSAPTDARAVLGRYDTSGAGPVVTVRLLRFPLQVFAASRIRHDELIREFSLLAIAPRDIDPDRPLPHRLVELIDTLGRRHRRTAERSDTIRDEAAARGELTADLTYRVPLSMREAMLALDRLMDEADLFCRTEHLLTLAPDPVEHRFRRWFTDQFIRQLAGEPPSPWTGPLRLPGAADDDADMPGPAHPGRS